MLIFAQALTCRRGFEQITQVAVTRAATKAQAEADGLAAIIANFPPSEGYTAHACACKAVGTDWILKSAAELLGVDFSEFWKG